MKAKAWIFHVAAMCVFAGTASAEPLTLVRGEDSVASRPFTRAYIDENGTLDAGGVLKLLAEKPNAFQPAPDRFRFFSGKVWLTFVVENQSYDNDDWFFEFNDKIAPILDVYVFGDRGLEQTFQLGTRHPASSRDYPSRSLLFRLKLAKGAHRTIVAAMWNHTVETNINVQNGDAFHQAYGRTNIVHATYFAVAAALFFYNVFLYLSLRYVFYLQYICFVAVMSTQIAINIGVLHYFTSDYLLFPFEYSYVCRGFVLLAALWFTRSFLHTKKTFPAADRIIVAVLYATVASIPFNFTPWNYLAIRFADLFTMGMGVLVVTVAAVVWRRGYRRALYYLISWTGLIGSTCYWILGNMGVLPAGYANQFVPEVGQMFEMLLISIALGDHINTLMSDKKSAEIRAVEGEKNRTLVRVISHDLLNPVGIIMNYAAHHLKNPASAGESLKSWQRVMAAAGQSQEIITHVQTMDAMLTGKKRLALSPVALAPLFTRLANGFQEKLDAKNVSLTIGPITGDLCVLADEASLMNDVMSNLVSNAIKFSAHGDAIRIAVAEFSDRVVITVADSGIGMDKELLSLIFDPYRPTTRVGTAGERGTGFGLPILKFYVEMYRGTVSVESRTLADSPNDHGTSFTVTLKRAQAAAPLVAA